MPLLYALENKSGLGFNELKRELKSKISSNMLSQVLEELLKTNLIEKHVVSLSPLRVIYSITMVDKDLCDLFLALGVFGSKYLTTEIS